MEDFKVGDVVELKVGDTVQLKSGGPNMTVLSVGPVNRDSKVEVAYFHEVSLLLQPMAYFPKEALKRVEPSKS